MEQNIENESSALPVLPTEAPKVSSARSPEAVQADCKKLVNLLNGIDSNRWLVGDLLIQLSDDGKTIGELSELTGRSQGDLSDIRAVARAYPSDVRDPATPFWNYQVALAAQRKAKLGAKALIEKTSPTEAIRETVKANVPTPLQALEKLKAHNKATGKKADKRKATNFLVNEIHDKIKEVTEAPTPVQSDTYLDRCHFGDCNDLLDKMLAEGIDWTAKLINLDPPYGSYDKHTDGHQDVGTSAARLTGTINPSQEEAVETTEKTIRRVAGLVGESTTVLLWQAAIEIRLPILKAIVESGLEVEMCVVWNKDVSKPGDFNSAWSEQSEFCWVIKKAGTKALYNHEPSSSRGNVLSAALTLPDGTKPFWFAQSAESIYPTHVWKKPMSMMEFFIKKHTYAGDIVLDLYGCTGTCSIAAAKLGRRFIYCEGYQENFDTFSSDVLRALEEAQQGKSKPLAGE